jgi:dethiobiotin synthetase
MLTIEALKQRKLNLAGIIFSGDKNEATESFILQNSGIRFIGRIDNEPYFDRHVIAEYAENFRDMLNAD